MKHTPVLLIGGLAGFLATVPMTVVMLALHRLLPDKERYEVPPKQVTEGVASRAGLGVTRRDPVDEIATGIAHFGFGAAAGSLFPPLARLLPAPTLLAGLLYGLMVWFGGYEGVLPSARILPPASSQPARRNLMMIASHLVWGGAMGWLTQRWMRAR